MNLRTLTVVAGMVMAATPAWAHGDMGVLWVAGLSAALVAGLGSGGGARLLRSGRLPRLVGVGAFATYTAGLSLVLGHGTAFFEWWASLALMSAVPFGIGYICAAGLVQRLRRRR